MRGAKGSGLCEVEMMRSACFLVSRSSVRSLARLVVSAPDDSGRNNVGAGKRVVICCGCAQGAYGAGARYSLWRIRTMNLTLE